MAWKLYVRRSDRLRDAEIDDFVKFTAILRFNDVETWALDAPVAGAASRMILEGGGIILKRDDDVVLSGPLQRSEARWNQDEDALTHYGSGDTEWLRRRLALPVPTGPPYTAAEHDVRTGLAETIMKQYVDVNAGPGAQLRRQVPGLVVPATSGLGLTVTGRARFQNLLDLLRSLALAGGDLGFRVLQSDDTDAALSFQMYVPQDRSASVKFSRDLQNLAKSTLVQEAPTGNYVIVGGGGEGTDRTFAELGNYWSIIAFGLVETFVDRRDTSDLDELNQTIDETLADREQQFGLSVTPLDTLSMQFGRDYGLGDQVAVVIAGQVLVHVIREVHIEITSEGTTVRPMIGTPGRASPGVPRMFRALSTLGRRIGGLERR